MAATVPVVAAASIDQRFAQLIQQFGLTKNSFAISLGKTASVVQHLIDGRNKPGFDLMCRVFEVYPNVSRDWLLLGRGPMLVGSNGASAASVASLAPKVPEPDFEPIDLADVAPRPARRAGGNRLHPDEITAALTLASAVANGVSAVAATLPAPVTADAANPVAPVFSVVNAAAAPPAATSLPAPELYNQPVAAKPMQRYAQPFRPGSHRATDFVASAPGAAPVPPIAPDADATPPLATLISTAPTGSLPDVSPVASAIGSPEAHVTAAIHAQHLQHQLALAELRNQHLLEQQQLLREMLAMARQGMV